MNHAAAGATERSPSTIHELVSSLEMLADRALNMAVQAENTEAAFVGASPKTVEGLLDASEPMEACIRDRIKGANRTLDRSLNRIQQSLNRVE